MEAQGKHSFIPDISGAHFFIPPSFYDIPFLGECHKTMMNSMILCKKFMWLFIRIIEKFLIFMYKKKKAAQIVPLFSFGIILENLIRLNQSVNPG
jgi:hypothetical protein